MYLSGHYSNPPGALETVLRCPCERLSSRQSAPKAIVPGPKRLGNGVIQRAVLSALGEADGAMDVGEAHAAVEMLLGRTVSRDSVTSCLSTGARGARCRFERVARGRYQLASSR
jgi:hypothetical protein